MGGKGRKSESLGRLCRKLVRHLPVPYQGGVCITLSGQWPDEFWCQKMARLCFLFSCFLLGLLWKKQTKQALVRGSGQNQFQCRKMARLCFLFAV